MRIENLRTGSTENGARVVATVSWEDCERPTQDIYFETVDEFTQALVPNPDAFLTACIIPAMRHGEERIIVDGEICAELRHGLITAMSWIRHWYGSERKLVRIEAETRRSVLTPQKPERAGVFFSGGVDSFASLRMNRLDFLLEHPSSFKDGILIFGNEVRSWEAFEYVVNQLSIAAEASDIKLIPVSTNVSSLDYDQGFWTDEFQGAVLSSGCARACA